MAKPAARGRGAQTRQPAKASVPATVKDESKLPAALMGKMAEASGQGLENLTARDYAIPLIKIVDKNSSYVDEASADYIEGIKPGAILNTVTKEWWPGNEGIIVTPCGFKSVMIEYNSPEPNSGFVAEHPALDPIREEATTNDRGQLILPNGHCLVDCNNHYIIHLTEEGPSQAILGMKSTQLKKSRRWNSLMSNRKAELGGRRFTPPIYGVKYKLITVAESKDKYNWFGWEIFDEGLVDDETIYQAGEDFYTTVQEGLVRANYAADEAGGGEQAPPYAE